MSPVEWRDGSLRYVAGQFADSGDRPVDDDLTRLIVKAITAFHLGPRPTEGDGYGTVNEARAVAAALRPVIDEARSDGYMDGYGDGQEYADQEYAEEQAR